MIEYGFTENQDFEAITQKRVTAQGNETEYTDHALKMDMAKEISMIQRNEKGKQARQYFIEVEKRFRNGPNEVETSNPELKMLQGLLNQMIQTDLAQKRIEKKVDAIADIVSIKPSLTWRDETTKMINLVANQTGNFEGTRREIYALLEKRAKVNLKVRRENMRNKAARQGLCKSKVNGINYLDVIEADQKLIEIFVTVVKDFGIKHSVLNQEAVN